MLEVKFGDNPLNKFFFFFFRVILTKFLKYNWMRAVSGTNKFEKKDQFGSKRTFRVIFSNNTLKKLVF